MALTSYTGTSGNFINLNIPQGYTSGRFTVNTTIPAGAYQLTLPSSVSSLFIGNKTFRSSGLVNIPTGVSTVTGDISYLPVVWSTRNQATATRQYVVAYGNGVFVQAGNGGKLGYSTDGLTWSSRDSLIGNTQINAITFGNGIFVIGGNRDDGTVSTRVSTSTDGLTWTSRAASLGAANGDIKALTIGDGTFFAVATDSTGGPRGGYSTDGITWTTVGQGNLGVSTGTVPESLGWGNGLFVFGGTGGQMSTSVSGLLWTTRTSGFGSSSINVIEYGNNLFFAGGAGGYVATSPDGITWTNRTTGSVDNIRGGGYFNGYYMLCGDGGTLVISTNGTNWTLRSPGLAASTAAVYNMAYGEGRYVLAMNNSDAIIVSSYTSESDATVQLEYKGTGATAV